ncbi:MAG: glycosyltransferase family 1 protein [Patescibacteria group bacterium]|jgi:glycosyltransferase involved in cell wall biosynthesis|nr:glycosyltransferase family 1 protein [Patescibacteria group bacterium]
MLIGIDASRANRKYKSGVEWYSYYIIRELAKLDSENEYILYTDEPLREGLADLTCAFDVEDICSEETEGIFEKNGLQRIKSPHNNFSAKVLKWNFNFLWTQGRLSLEMIFSRPDILFVPSHTLPIIHPKKSIVTIHDIGFVNNTGFYSRDRMGPESNLYKKFINVIVRIFTLGKFGANTTDYLFWSTKFALKKAKTVLTVSKFTKKEIIDIYGDKVKNVEVVYNGYNNNIYKKIEDKEKIQEVLDRYGITGPYLFYVGRIDKKKNIPELVEAYAIMREKDKNIKHKLVLVGSASFGIDEVMQLSEDYRLENDLIIPGWVEEVDMPYLFNGADAFVFPSKYEGFGIPLLQSMACGIPIAASWAASIPEITKKAALLFNPNSVEDMSGAISRIINDEKLRDELKKLGAERVKKFSWSKTAGEILKLLNKT